MRRLEVTFPSEKSEISNESVEEDLILSPEASSQVTIGTGSPDT